MTTRSAWFCPSCQRHHAPHCDTCPAPALYGLPGTVPNIPVWTPWQQPSTGGDPRVWSPNISSAGGTSVKADPNVFSVLGDQRTGVTMKTTAMSFLPGTEH